MKYITIINLLIVFSFSACESKSRSEKAADKIEDKAEKIEDKAEDATD